HHRDLPPERSHRGRYVVLIDRDDLARLDAPGTTPQRPALDQVAQSLDLLAVQGLWADAELEAVVVGRVVAAGHLHTAAESPVPDREVDQWCRTHAEVRHVHARAGDSFAQGGGVPVGGEPAVTPDAEKRRALLGRHGRECTPEQPGEVGVEVALRDAADVVFAEDRRIQLNTSTECRSRRSLDSQSWKRCSTALW